MTTVAATLERLDSLHRIREQARPHTMSAALGFGAYNCCSEKTT